MLPHLLAEGASPDLSTAHGIVTLALGLALGLAAWFGKDKVHKQEQEVSVVSSRQEANREAIGRLSEDVAVLKASKLDERVNEHAAQIKSLEKWLTEINGNVLVILATMRDIEKRA